MWRRVRAPATGPLPSDRPRGGHIPGRSTIPHLSQRLAALAANPAESIRAQARITATPEAGPGSLLRQHGTDRLLVDIRVARWDAAVIARLRATGARFVYRDAALRAVTAAVVPSALLALSRVTGVQYMTEIAAPQFSAVCDGVISEGDTILHAVQERTNAAVDGTGSPSASCPTRSTRGPVRSRMRPTT